MAAYWLAMSGRIKPSINGSWRWTADALKTEKKLDGFHWLFFFGSPLFCCCCCCWWWWWCWWWRWCWWCKLFFYWKCRVNDWEFHREWLRRLNSGGVENQQVFNARPDHNRNYGNEIAIRIRGSVLFPAGVRLEWTSDCILASQQRKRTSCRRVQQTSMAC